MRKFPSKILLFGEYSILYGSDALAIPYFGFQGEWSFERTDDPGYASSRSSIEKFISWFKDTKQQSSGSDILDIANIEQDMQKGLYFKSDIPEGSGLGSSGAIVAAIFQHYGTAKEELRDPVSLQKVLSALENHFHTSSSGIDPLISTLGQAVLTDQHGVNILRAEQYLPQLKDYGLFLVRSNIVRDSAVHIKHFRDQFESDSVFKNKVLDHYTPRNNQCIHSFLSHKDQDHFFACLAELTSLQSDLFRTMYPEPIFSVMKQGLASQQFFLKLCGSGGGGYYIGFTREMEKTRQVIEDNGLQILVY